MKLSRAEVEHIAELAKLELTEEEKIKFCEQLPRRSLPQPLFSLCKT